MVKVKLHNELIFLRINFERNELFFSQLFCISIIFRNIFFSIIKYYNAFSFKYCTCINLKKLMKC